MRVLTSRLLARCAVGALFAVSCYDPTVEDCHFVCGAEAACPAGTMCMAGFCRDTATGTCQAGGSDAGTNLDAAGDALACPATSPCSSARPVRVGADACAVLCTQPLTFDNALGMCGSDTGASAAWHIAILDTPAKRTAFGQVLPMSVAWVGLKRTVTTWNWLDPSNEVQAGSGAPWASGEPSTANVYGTFDSTNGNDVLRTGSITDSKQYLCEYRQ